MPSTTSCPGDTTSWPQQALLVSNMTNEYDPRQSTATPVYSLFRFCPNPEATSNQCSSTPSDLSTVKAVQTDLFVDPDPQHWYLNNGRIAIPDTEIKGGGDGNVVLPEQR